MIPRSQAKALTGPRRWRSGAIVSVTIRIFCEIIDRRLDGAGRAR